MTTMAALSSKLPRLKISALVAALEKPYMILQEQVNSTSKNDPFSKSGIMNFYDQTDDDWLNHQKIIQQERAWTMSMGYLHQNLMGDGFDGWETYDNGHETGCDTGSKDGKVVTEVKNNVNTMNSSQKESIYNKLKRQVDLGKRAVLVIVNGDTKKKMLPGGIEHISGRDFYAELSGSPAFYDNLVECIGMIFREFKTYDQLKAALGTT